MRERFYTISSDVYRVYKNGSIDCVGGSNQPLWKENNEHATTYEEALVQALRIVYDIKAEDLEREYEDVKALSPAYSYEMFLVEKLNQCSNIYNFTRGQTYCVKYIHSVETDTEDRDYYKSKVVWRNENLKRWRKEQKEAAHQDKIERAEQRLVDLERYIERLKNE